MITVAAKPSTAMAKPELEAAQPWRGQAVAYGEAFGMGSKRILVPRTGKAAGKPFLVDDNRLSLRAWQQELREAMQACAPQELLLGPVAVELTVFVLRPGSHYGTGRNAGQLKAAAPVLPRSGKDLDKVLRACLDVGSGTWWKNDAQICYASVSRVYCERQPRTLVCAWELVGVVGMPQAGVVR